MRTGTLRPLLAGTAWSVSVQLGSDGRAFWAKGELLKRAMAPAKPLRTMWIFLPVGGGTVGVPRFLKRASSWGSSLRSSASVKPVDISLNCFLWFF